MPLARRFVLTLLACQFAAASASGQGSSSKVASTLEIPNPSMQSPEFQVLDVAPGGTVRFEARPGPMKERFLLPEGHYLLMPRPDRGDPRLIRAQVTEVLAGGIAIASVGPGASSRLRAGDSFSLTRPFNATTALLRSLPDVIPIGDKPKLPPADALEDQRIKSLTNLRKIGQAIRNFEMTCGHLPPAIVFGPDGKPWHSWRVLLLPFLEEVKLYNEYDFTQPWDGEKNIKLLDRMPDVYRDPIFEDDRGHFTHYAALVGSWKGKSKEIHTAFPPSGAKMKTAQDKLFRLSFPVPLTSRDVTDGPSKTIAIAPVTPDRKIPWLKPDDITINPDLPGLGRSGGLAAPYRTGDKQAGPRTAPLVMIDGTTMSLLDTIEVETLRALTTRDSSADGVAESIDLAKIPKLSVPAPLMAPFQQGVTLKLRVEGRGARAWIER